RLGRENILSIAEGNPPGGDPDLQPSWDAFQYRRAVGMILDHAKGVLLPIDAARLAAAVQRERERVKAYPTSLTFISPSYAVAEARLLQDKAGEILHTEIRIYSGHREVS